MFSAIVNKTKAFVGITDSHQSIHTPRILDSEKSSLSTIYGNFVMENNNEARNEYLQGTVFDCIRTIRDPEKPATLEELEVVYEDGIKVTSLGGNEASIVDIEFNPTVPHCTLATLIGLCMRIKVERNVPEKLKLDIHIKKGAHDTEEEINKQINDKERVAAAMENPNLREMVEKYIAENDS